MVHTPQRSPIQTPTIFYEPIVPLCPSHSRPVVPTALSSAAGLYSTVYTEAVRSNTTSKTSSRSALYLLCNLLSTIPPRRLPRFHMPRVCSLHPWNTCACCILSKTLKKVFARVPCSRPLRAASAVAATAICRPVRQYAFSDHCADLQTPSWSFPDTFPHTRSDSSIQEPPN